MRVLDNLQRHSYVPRLVTTYARRLGSPTRNFFSEIEHRQTAEEDAELKLYNYLIVINVHREYYTHQSLNSYAFRELAYQFSKIGFRRGKNEYAPNQRPSERHLLDYFLHFHHTMCYLVTKKTYVVHTNRCYRVLKYRKKRMPKRPRMI